MGSTSNLSLALTLSNLMLPGVSVINSGEEYGEVANTKFIWDEASNKPDLAATHEGKLSLSMVQSAIKKKTADTLSKPSLRYDTRDEDTVFEFVDQGDQNVVGFWRKYHTKSGVYVVTNLSDKMIPIQLKAIQQHEDKLEKLWLIFKVQLKDTQTLAEAKITNGTKVMLLGTAEKEVLSANKKFKAETGGTVTASTTTKKQPLCEQKLHKRIVDQGKPDDAMPAYVNGTEALPRVAVTGMKNKAGNKVRLTFKLTADEVWISTKERTEKVGMSSIRSIVFEPIKGHEEYHIMGFGVGTTESSRYWIYWVPAQYVKAIKSTIMDN